MSQLPNGSLPLGNTNYINAKEFSIDSYESETFAMKFYFPAIG